MPAHGDYYKHFISLIEDKYNQAERPDYVLQDDKICNEMIIDTAAKLEVLLQLLMGKGLLEQNQLTTLQQELVRRCW